MENEKFQELVLQQLKILTDGQHRLESRLTSVEDRIISLEKGQQEIKSELKYSAPLELKSLVIARSDRDEAFLVTGH
jgi:hypothetical protein